jgi:hypothetical protein
LTSPKPSISWEQIRNVITSIKTSRHIIALIVIAVIELPSLLLSIRPELAFYIVIVIIGLLALAYSIIREDSKGKRYEALNIGSSLTYRSVLDTFEALREQAPTDEERRAINRAYAMVEQVHESHIKQSGGACMEAVSDSCGFSLSSISEPKKLTNFAIPPYATLVFFPFSHF